MNGFNRNDIISTRNKATNRNDLTRSITKGGDDENSAVTNGIL